MSEVAKKTDPSNLLAENIVGTDYESLPREVVKATKKSILDTLGVIAAASGIANECRLLVNLIKEAGGREESSIIGFGGRVPVWMAAFANGAMGHCLDYDDLHYGALVHPSSSVVSASLAVAERVGNISGKEFVTAVALGNDLMCRMGLATHWKMDWNLTTVFGPFGAVAASAKLFGLGKSNTVSALGIALSEASGTREMRYSTGNHIGGIRDGYPASGGVFSALMAQRGIKGPENCFEGKAGLFNVYFGGDFEREILIAELGERFEGAQVGIKAWPTCGLTHVYIDACQRIIADHDLCPQDIETITLHVGDLAMHNCQPVEERRYPQNSSDAKFSIPFCVAVAATKKGVTIGDLTPEGIKNPKVLDMAQKVIPKYDARFNVAQGQPPGMVAIATRDGVSYYQAIEFGYGHPRNPISEEDTIRKFWDCISYSANPVSKDTREKIVEMVMGIEKVKDVSLMARLLS